MTSKVDDIVIENAVENATRLSEASAAMLKKFSEEAVQHNLSREGLEFYKLFAETVLKFRQAEGIKTPKDAEEQEARILNLRRQAQAESDKDKTIVVQFTNAEEYSE